MKTIEHWIAGQPTRGSSTRFGDVWNPATGARQAQVALAEPADVDAAVAAALKAYDSWRDVSVMRRTRVMFRFAELVRHHMGELAAIISNEHGKVVADAEGEIQRGLEVVEFVCGTPHLLKGDYSDQASGGIDMFSYRQPLGVCAGISPFNFPVMVPLWMHPVAIACGNAFVLKPSERDPSASNLIAELYAEAGLPDGVFNVVHGDKVAVDAILDHSDVAAVSFVGSTPVARHIHQRASAAGKRVQALGGAKNHAVVLPDADLDFAADQVAAAGYGSAGQRCMAISAVVAVGEAGDALVDRLRERATSVVVGPGQDDRSQMGPLVTAAARDRVLGAISDGVAEGGRLVVDGRDIKIPGHEGGFFVGPTLFDHVKAGMRIYSEEVFGPVLVVLRAGTLEEAIGIVNANPYGNGTAVFTSSGEAARTFQRAIQVGMVGVNVPIPVPLAFYSFGGWKDSLFGDKHVYGPEGVSFYTRAKVVTSRWPHIERPVEAHYNFPTA